MVLLLVLRQITILFRFNLLKYVIELNYSIDDIKMCFLKEFDSINTILICQIKFDIDINARFFKYIETFRLNLDI